jgi:hypothetical protein
MREKTLLTHIDSNSRERMERTDSKNSAVPVVPSNPFSAPAKVLCYSESFQNLTHLLLRSFLDLTGFFGFEENQVVGVPISKPFHPWPLRILMI